MEKKLKGNQKLALERIYRLFELAQGLDAKDPAAQKHAKRYLQLAKRIGEKTNTSIPKELKQKYCKKCYSLKVKQAKREPFVVVKCEDCGAEKKFGIEKKPSSTKTAKKAKAAK